MSEALYKLAAIFNNLKKAHESILSSNKENCNPRLFCSDAQDYIVESMPLLSDIEDEHTSGILKTPFKMILEHSIEYDYSLQENRILLDVLIRDAIKRTSIALSGELTGEEYHYLNGYESPDSILRMWFSGDDRCIDSVASTQTYVGYEFPIFVPDGKYPHFWFTHSEEAKLGEEYKNQCLLFTLKKKNWVFWGKQFQYNSIDDLEAIPPFFVYYFIEGHNQLATERMPDQLHAVLLFLRNQKARKRTKLDDKELNDVLNTYL